MPTVRILDRDARARLRTRRSDEPAPYREAIGALVGDRVLELIPHEGESLRTLKSRTSRASTEVGRRVTYGETEEGTLLVWLARPARRRSVESNS